MANVLFFLSRSMVRTSTIYRLRCLLVVFHQMACEVSQRYEPVNDSDVKKIDR